MHSNIPAIITPRKNSVALVLAEFGQVNPIPSDSQLVVDRAPLTASNLKLSKTVLDSDFTDSDLDTPRKFKRALTEQSISGESGNSVNTQSEGDCLSPVSISIEDEMPNSSTEIDETDHSKISVEPSENIANGNFIYNYTSSEQPVSHRSRSPERFIHRANTEPKNISRMAFENSVNGIVRSNTERMHHNKDDRLSLTVEQLNLSRSTECLNDYKKNDNGLFNNSSDGDSYLSDDSISSSVSSMSKKKRRGLRKLFHRRKNVKS